MSQPSLSRHIANLEHDLNCKLFFDSQGLTLTAEGELVYARATEIINNYDNMIRELRSKPHRMPERIIIQDMLHFDTLYTGIMEAMKKTQEIHPNVRFEYEKGQSGERLVDMIGSGSVDVAFRLSVGTERWGVPPAPAGLKGVAIPHFHGILNFGLRKGSPVLENKNLVFNDFATSTFLLPAMRRYDDFADNFISVCKDAGFYPKIKYIPVNNIHEFYARNPGDDVIIITRMAGDDHTTFDAKIRENLTVINPRDKTYYINATMLYPDGEHSETFNTFIDAVKACEEQREIQL
jgi:hypothetical protein